LDAYVACSHYKIKICITTESEVEE